MTGRRSYSNANQKVLPGQRYVYVSPESTLTLMAQAQTSMTCLTCSVDRALGVGTGGGGLIDSKIHRRKWRGESAV